MNMKQRSRKLARRQDGQGMVELALILVLVALMAILTLTTMGNQVNLTFQDIQEAIANPSDPGASSPYSCPGGTMATLHGHKYHCQ
jgi:Flp pilus assembly pilin Flp